jgi:hypothetical protein
MPRVVCCVVKQLGLREAGKEHQRHAQQGSDECRPERFLSFGRSDYRYGRTGHVILLIAPPAIRLQKAKRRQVSWLSGLRLWPPSRFPSGMPAIG